MVPVSYTHLGKRASKELRVDDIVNIGIGIPEMVSRFARKSGMLDMVTLTVAVSYTHLECAQLEVEIW